MAIETAEKRPDWLDQMIQDIGKQFRPLGSLGQLGFRYLSLDSPYNTTQRWLVGVYLVPYELAGGNQDGLDVVAGFRFDLGTLLSLFSPVSTLEWRVPRSYTDGLSGPELWLEGRYRGGETVQLHIYAECPSDETSTVVLDVATGTFRSK